jgi:hypothetical protein
VPSHRLIHCLLGATSALLLCLALGTSASAQAHDLSAFLDPADLPPGLCDPEWSAPFGPEPGVGNGGSNTATIYDAVVFDDGLGGGPALYVGGLFSSAGGEAVSNLARWDGSDWSDVGGGVNGTVEALAVADFGSGPELYLGGAFTEGGGGVVLANIARWDGAGFSDVGGGTSGTVRSLVTLPAGLSSSDTLVLGGSFGTAGGITSGGFGVAVQNIASWSGVGFAALGAGFTGPVMALTQHDNSLYAGGDFNASGATFVYDLARWTGSAWEAVGGGGAAIGGGYISELTSYDDGTGSALVVGGSFSNIGIPPVPANDVAAWDGVSWDGLGGGIDGGHVAAVHAWDDGTGEALYVGGGFSGAGGTLTTRSIARWDGASWSALGPGIALNTVFCLTDFDEGGGSSLFAGGSFVSAGGLSARGIARWDGASWSPTSAGLNVFVQAVASGSFEGSPTLYAGGVHFFHAPNAVDQRGIARFKDGAWSGIGDLIGSVQAMAVFDDGTGEALYVGGGISEVAGVPVSSLARWDGSTWSSVGSGVNGGVFALEVWDDGNGPALYVGGTFSTAGGVPANRIAKWDGSSFSPLAGGLGPFGGIVFDMEEFDGALHVSGGFSEANGAPGNSIARWDGSTWSNLGAGIQIGGVATGEGECLAVYDDGSGKRLFVGGNFDTAGGVAGHEHLAIWDGAAWSSLDVNDEVLTLAVYDPGTGPELMLGGAFSEAGGSPFPRLARWDGAQFAGLGSGITQPDTLPLDMLVHDLGEGLGPQLIVGGEFSSVPDIDPSGSPGGGSYLGAWGGCWQFVNAWVDLGFALPGTSGDPLLLASGSLALGSQNVVVLFNANPLATAGLFLSFASTPVPFAGGTLVPFPFLDPLITTVSNTGIIPLSYTVTDCLPPGITLYVQWAISDGGAVSGIALSNALVGTTP